VDKHFAQYPASLSENPRSDLTNEKKSNEEVVCLERMVKERLSRYKEVRNGELPGQIIVYRDGLSEEQFAMCKTSELGQIRAALDAVYNPPSLQTTPKSSPKSLMSSPKSLTSPKQLLSSPKQAASRKLPLPLILLICVVKRNHCRFIPSPDVISAVYAKTAKFGWEKKDSTPQASQGNPRGRNTILTSHGRAPAPFNIQPAAIAPPNETPGKEYDPDSEDPRFCSALLDRNGNPRPGCLVDNTVTYGEGADFFLVSHKAM
jgi:hypothetical protein